ncbi:hypothetical protein A2U01_0109117, partial [Trifolium medium]|nr:hypothetical protein [Trifolium medium]
SSNGGGRGEIRHLDHGASSSAKFAHEGHCCCDEDAGDGPVLSDEKGSSANELEKLRAKNEKLEAKLLRAEI